MSGVTFEVMQTPKQLAKQPRFALAALGQGSGVRGVCSLLSVVLCGACGGAHEDFWGPAFDEGASVAGAPVAIPSSAGTNAGGSSGSSATVGGAQPTMPTGTVGGAQPAMPTETEPSGGAAGIAGASVAMRSLVDDMEANVSSIPESDGRAGFWYTFNDGQGGAQLPAPNGPFLPDLSVGGYPGSARARHTQGRGFNAYAGFGFDLNNHSGARQQYDASAYGGIVLWVRGSVNVRVLFPTRATAPVNEGGACTSSCNDSFGLDVPVTDQWTQQTVSFATLHQLGAPTAGDFDPKALLGIAFSVPAGSEFDVWVDEIGFY